ncbi:MAG: DUF1631 family protein [Gammaproteobacteria bacterium]|nr:DUF1631 family protein [Gammaproteobacteria bacterium]
MTDPADRRRYERFEIKLPARIMTHDGDMVGCVVRDYCGGGMLVSLPVDQPAEALFKKGQRTRLATKLLTHAGRRPVSIKSSVAWMRDNFLGIRFDKPSDLMVDVLKRHDRYARARPAANEQRAAKATPPHFERITAVAQALLPGILREIIGLTLDTLVETVDRVSSDAERQQVYGDMNALDRLREQDTLVRSIVGRATSLHPGRGFESEVRPGELALVDTEEFERWLETSRVATLLERKFRPEIAVIGTRLAGMRGSDAPVSLVVPFEPKHFTDAFSDVARDIELGTLTRSVMFERCADVLSEALTELYSQMNKALDEIGVPSQDVAGAMRRVKNIGRQNVSNFPSSGAVAADAVAALATEPTPTGVAHPIDLPTVAIDPKRLQALLDSERQLRESQASELVDGLSAEMAGDPGLKAWIDVIGSSFVGEAAANPGFFQNDRHPLRAIVDELGHLQQFLAHSPDDLTRQLRREVDSLLAPLRDGEFDAKTADAVAGEVGALARRRSAEYQRNVERVIEASDGRDRVRRARTLVAKEIDRRYAGRLVPEVASELLNVGWRAGLELAWLNAETGRGDYQRQLSLLDSIVDLLGGEAYAPGRGERDKLRLVKAIGEQLATTAVDPYRRGAVESRLRVEFNARPEDVPKLRMPVRFKAEKRAADSRPEQIGESAWRSALERCRALHLGDWVEFKDVKDTSEIQVALRVAWIRADREWFTLVDNRGVRVRDISLHDLAQSLCEERVSLQSVDGKPLSQRAVARMLGAMEGRLVQQAGQESQTGLMGRQAFQVVVEKALAGDPKGALLWVDIDQFKLINELHDYATGDRLLAALGEAIVACPGDKTVAHLGADRFAILLDDVALEQATDWAERLLDSVRGLTFDVQNRTASLHVSIGLVALGGELDTAGQVTRAVENALSAAKAGGGDQVYVYREDDPDMARRRDSVEWLVRVDEALVDGHLRLRCQPIVPVRPDAGLSPHHEVLLGVATANNELLSIAEFIEAAERYKRMRAVDRWITREVFDWVAAHRELMPQIHGLAVNLSGQTASDPTFVEFVRQQFSRTGVDPAWISFEVTETAAVASLSCAAGIIHGLKHLGCHIALDDFGSGQASYAYLKELPVDWLKIDGVFVRDIAEDRNDFAVVRSINEIGHFLGKKTIAEYVKDAATLDMVAEIGVDYAQGFAIAKPMLLDELANMCRRDEPMPSTAQVTD